jgi:hypothetical protein
MAAHLSARDIEHRIIGDPMQFWLEHMPERLLLKSDGFASTLYDPGDDVTLRYYCEERNTACSHFKLSVPGLFFVGPAAVDSFGPPSPRLWREVTARRLPNYLARTSRLAER